LDHDALGRLNSLFESRFALQRPRVLGAVIMSRLPITTPKRGCAAKAPAVFSLAEITKPE